MDRKFVIALCLFSFQVFARNEIKLNEKPALRAALRSVSEDGSPIYTFAYENNQLTQNQIKDKVSSFLFEERRGSPCPIGSYCMTVIGEVYRKINFDKVSVGHDHCGSKRYVARSSTSNAKLIVLDHLYRACDDYKADRWEVTLVEGKKSSRYFRGNPESVVQTDCERYVRNTICTLQMMPVTCSAQTVNWEPLTPAVVAQGSNPCFAEAALKKSICERSYNADKLQPEEIVCAPSGFDY